jgi:hypothetical protein
MGKRHDAGWGDRVLTVSSLPVFLQALMQKKPRFVALRSAPKLTRV